ncbi:MAG: Response regulator receiver [Frankiales bacterium]|nr:Response regulator receiver [Frankiales bacterium]
MNGTRRHFGIEAAMAYAPSMDPLRDACETFPAESSSVAAARRFVAAELARLQLDDVEWPVVQAVSELATNCVLHAHTGFSVGVRALADGAVRLEVADGATGRPRERAYGTDAATGRGVALVAGLARSWGVEPRTRGKVVWCEIATTPLGSGSHDDAYAEVDPDAFLSRSGRADDFESAASVRTAQFVYDVQRGHRAAA